MAGQTLKIMAGVKLLTQAAPKDLTEDIMRGVIRQGSFCRMLIS